jgi:uroporphyrinogen decarboxylase
MNSRERVIAAVEHRESDAVPVDLGSTPSSGISAIAYNNLVKHLGINGCDAKIYDVVQELAQVDDEIIGMFGIDVIDIGRAFNTEFRDWHPIILSDNSRAFYPAWFRPVLNNGAYEVFDAEGDRIAVKPAGATFFDQTVYPYQEAFPADYENLPEAIGKVHWSALAHSPWDHSSDPGFWDTLRQKTVELRETSGKALMISAGCNLFEWGCFLRRMDNFLTDIYIEQENVERLLDALMELHLTSLGKICSSIGDVIDIIRLGDDLGMNSGPFMDTDTYRNIFKPRHAVLNKFIKDNSKAHTFLHSCGSISSLIPDLIDAGFEIINPVQTNAFDMDPERLKREFGRDVTFWGGGADTRSVLNHGLPGEVRDHVLKRLEIFSPGGGYVFNPIHNILPDVPPQNIISMFDAVKEFNKK